MAPVAQDLPVQFPCWVKAVYSWGGETKRDLGFMEGDLIECLNAGDGSWWVGRLRRDPRMVGSFPSNFVQVLDESFQLPSRSPSPLPPPAAQENKAPLQKSKTWRKPFQAYHKAGSPNPEAAAREIQSRAGSVAERNSSRASRRPFSSMHKLGNPAAAAGPERGGSRLAHQRPMSQIISPTVRHQSSFTNDRSRFVRPESSQDMLRTTYSRAQSPNLMMYQGSRAPSPNPHRFDTRDQSPPPPPPPQHRYAQSRAASPNPMAHNAHTHANSTRTPDPRIQKSTPSPFTEAFNQIMDTFEDMTVAPDQEPVLHESFPQGPVWGPDDYAKLYGGPARQQRPHTSMTMSQPDSGYHTGFENEAEKTGDAQLDDYIPRMERRLRELQQTGYQEGQNDEDISSKPPIPAKDSSYNLREQIQRPFSALSHRKSSKRLKKQKSAYELATQALGRTFTLKSTATTTTNSSNSTNRSIWSGTSAGGMSNASAGSFYNKKFGLSKGNRPMSSIDLYSGGAMSYTNGRPETPLSGPSYHSSHDSNATGQESSEAPGLLGGLGGLSTPSPRKSGFVRRMLDSARATAATARSTISAAGNHSRPGSPTKLTSKSNTSMVGLAGGTALTSSARPQSSAAREMGLGGTMDWVQVRRDVHRSNSIGKNERRERAERCQVLDIPVLYPVEEFLQSVEGDEGIDGLPISHPTDFTTCNLQMVDKSARFVNNLPPSTTVASLIQGYLCRPYRSDVQRLRAIFTWVSERISWEDDYEGDINVRRVLQTKRGCSQEIAMLVADMCAATGIHAEVIQGYLKTPGDALDIDLASRSNHWWTAVIVDGEWRIMDCSLASPTNPKRAHYSTTSSQMAESFWFLTRPTEICYTHVPVYPEQQHIVPIMPNDILLSLPCVCPTYFKNNMEIWDFDTSILHLENLELAHTYFMVPEDVECTAEIEVRTFARDMDGDLFESGDVQRKPALAQAEWYNGRKRYTVKTLLPGDEGQGVLKIYAGKRGLMHSIKSNPHPLALALPIFHTGQNPPYNFLTRHPTPHAQRHDLYVAQPQCARLVANNTFVFSVRQHPSSLTRSSPNPSASAIGGRASPNPFARPTSAMSMASVSASGSNYSAPSNSSGSTSSSNNILTAAGVIKPAKLAIQTPSGKIIRLTRRMDAAAHNEGEKPDGSEWETVIKVGERGIWRALVLADRSARWCVFAEWECV